MNNRWQSWSAYFARKAPVSARPIFKTGYPYISAVSAASLINFEIINYRSPRDLKQKVPTLQKRSREAVTERRLHLRKRTSNLYGVLFHLRID